MKVCIATTSLPRWSGDTRSPFILEAARAIRAQGVDVRVVTVHSPGAKTREVLESIEVVRSRYLWPERLEVLQKEGGGLPVMWRKNRLARLTLIPFFIAHCLAVTRFARDCDLIHANWTLSGIAAWSGQMFHKKPYIVTVQGSDVYQAARIPFAGILTEMALNEAGRVLTLSHSLAQATRSLGVDSQRIEILPNGVDIERFHPSTAERQPYILFVGSLIERKGVKYLIQAMPQILRSFPDYRLVIVGEGPQLGQLCRLVSSLSIDKGVDFVGPKSPCEIHEWMQHATLFVLPSVEEGLGVVLLEALASGTPCVATLVGGIPDVVSSDVGILVPPADSDALAGAVLRLLEDRHLWDTMSESARARAVTQFSWEMIGSRLVQIYRNVLDSKQASP